MSCEKGFNYTEAYQQHGNGKYLGEGEIFEGVVAQDAKVLEEHGVTKEEVGQSLRALFSTFNEFLRLRAPGAQHPCPNIELGSHTYELGSESCPYVRGVDSNRDWIVGVEGLSNGNKAYHPEHGPTFVSDMLPDMIEQLGFFEGSVFYGIKPEWAIAVHRIVQQNELTPYISRHEQRAWDEYKGYFKSWEGVIDERTGRDMLEAPKQVIANTVHQEQLTPDIKAYVAHGDLNLRPSPFAGSYYSRVPSKRQNEYWGLLIADRESVVPSDARLMGIPFDAYINTLSEGEILLIRVLPDFDKLVG